MSALAPLTVIGLASISLVAPLPVPVETSPCHAPFDPQEHDDERDDIRAFQVQYADPEEVQELLHNLLEGEFASCVTDVRTGQVFMRANASVLSVAAGLIEKLDRRVDDQDRMNTVLLNTRYRQVDEFEEILSLHSSRGGRLVIDESRNVIVMKETPEVIAKARELLAQLDQPVADLAVHFLVLGHSEVQLPPLPDTPSMRKVKEELVALGLSGYGILSRAAVITQEHDHFDVNGANDMTTLKASGRIHLISEDSKAQLELALEVHSSETEGRAHVETTVKVPLNHLMILGITPAGGSAGRPLVIVAEARRL